MTEVESPERRNFSKIRSFMDLPNLIDVQRRSYERFLQMTLLPEERIGRMVEHVGQCAAERGWVLRPREQSRPARDDYLGDGVDDRDDAVVLTA